MKKSTKTLIYSIAVIVAILTGITIYLNITNNRSIVYKSTTKKDVECNHIFSSVKIDSLAFDFPDYGHTDIIVMPGETDTVIFESDKYAKKIGVSQEDNILKFSTVPDFNEYLSTKITVVLKHIPMSIYSNGVEWLTLKNITTDYMALDIKQNVHFDKCHLNSINMIISRNYASGCIISGDESHIKAASIMSIEPIDVFNGISFEHLTLIGSQPGLDNNVTQQAMLKPSISFASNRPPIKIEKGEYPFGVYLDGPIEIN